jgi:hypothetical protein
MNGRLHRLCFATAIFCLAASLPALAADESNANQLVRSVINNEIQAEQRDNSRWLYLSDDTEKGKRQIKEVVETPDGSLSLLVQQDGTPLTADSLKQQEQQLRQFAQDPNQMQKRKQAGASDAQKAQRLMQMLPDAFIYKEDGQDENGFTRLSFTPNPNFNPPTREAKVFHSMAGTVTVDPKTRRLVGISGHLIHDVNFGWGILGTLHKGGTFDVKREEVAPGTWKETLTDVHISGHALFFHTISEQQHEVRSRYQRVDDNLSPMRAADLLIRHADEVGASKTAALHHGH